MSSSGSVLVEHPKRALPPISDGLPKGRRAVGLVLAVAGLPVLTAVLASARSVVSLPSDLLLYLLAVVFTAAVGGVLPAVVAAISAAVQANYWFIPPYYTFTIAQPDHALALVVFVVVAVTVSVTVEIATRLRSQATRSRAEAATLSTLAGNPQEQQSVPHLLEQVRTTFGMDSVAILRPIGTRWVPIVAVGAERDWSNGSGQIRQVVKDDLRLVGCGPEIFAEDRRLLAAYSGAVARSLATLELSEQAARARELAAVDELRAALLAAVGHDLRTPLAGIKAAVSSLRQEDIEWTPQESAELLATVEESADRLNALVSDLLDMSRLRAGALSVDVRPVALDEVVPAALLGGPVERVQVSVAESLPMVLADAALLQRAVGNLVANAVRFSPPDKPVQIRAGVRADQVTLSVVDSGPGVPNASKDRMFAPFQRLDDSTAGGVGLGLAIASGFVEAMGGTLVPSDTPGGGLTMTISLRQAH